jgi:hypothetical protein
MRMLAGTYYFRRLCEDAGKAVKSLAGRPPSFPCRQTNKHARNERLPPPSQLVQCAISLQKRARKRNSLAAINDVCFPLILETLSLPCCCWPPESFPEILAACLLACFPLEDGYNTPLLLLLLQIVDGVANKNSTNRQNKKTRRSKGKRSPGH